ncbi:polysaccharide lyase family protein [Aestuariibaculum marinum]|uniref:rhamnogalacturonan endolyase n=1 Tax=Aestuariibaculum marinum TaxID=2683592 RepID=A0A8J6U446_9FLAO|nr:polysaccharide lyase family protein [Aestuariibaculum marinum]MBD0823707.1 T9SS type A sorting domain-containing protein [Aestuariibaculum marinum]
MRKTLLKKGFTTFFGLIMACTSLNFLNAQNNWQGDISSDFYDVNNWSDNTIDFANAGSQTLVIGAGNPNNPLQIGGSNSIGARPDYLNTISGANATFNGTLYPWNSDMLNGTVTLNAPALLSIRNVIYIGKGDNGTVNINGGALYSRFQTIIGYNTGGNGTVNVNGGTLYVGNYLEVATSPSGTNPTGTLNISGGVVDVTTAVNIGTNGNIIISSIGALILTGDHTTTLENYISNGKISALNGENLSVNFDGSRTTVSIAQDPNRMIEEYASYIILKNDYLEAKIEKSTSNIQSLKVNGVETLATFNAANNSRIGTYYDFTGSYGFDKISGTVFSIKEETEDYIDVSFKRTYSDGNYLAPCDADIHYVLKKNDTGIYTYSILTHKAEYPAFDLGSWRQVVWIGNDGTDYLAEKIYVTEQKSWEMPSVYDFSQASGTPIPEIIKLNTGVRAGKYDGKYEYCENLIDIPAYGHASDKNNIGSWAVFGSHEFFNAGPTNHDLNAAAGIIHIDMNTVHYNCRGFSIPQGEEWSKIYGPYLIYTSTVTGNGDAQWADAKTRAAQDKAEWPFSWLTNTPEYPLADGRGNITGNFSISDSEKPDLDGSNAWIGVTQLTPASDGDWQFEDKNYQYWVKTDASGNFDIKHVRPGTYTLFAFKNGAVDEYRMENVTVTAGGTTSLGNVTWTIPRNNGKLLWEIGIPDRTAAEYKFGDFDYCEGFVEDKFENTFSNPIEYNIEDNNWATVLPYVHTKYIKSDGSRDAWNWNINFTVTGTIPTTGNAKLTVAFASVDHAQFWLYLNGNNVYLSYPTAPSGGNAWIRQSNRSKYGIQTFNIPYSSLVQGENTLTFLMPSNQSNSHLMYDYISLEGSNITVQNSALSTENFESDFGIKMFPNPTNGTVNIQLPNTVNNLITELYSVNGSLISRQTHKTNTNRLELDLSDKPEGIYFLKLVSDYPATLKIIKNR